MITEKLLKEKGYKEFEVPIINRYATKFYQKRIRDEKGTKYFIDVYGYENCSMMSYEIALSQEKLKYCMRINFYALNTTLKEIEKDIEELWVALGSVYYERWEEQ